MLARLHARHNLADGGLGLHRDNGGDGGLIQNRIAPVPGESVPDSWNRWGTHAIVAQPTASSLFSAFGTTLVQSYGSGSSPSWMAVSRLYRIVLIGPGFPSLE